jgi:hypothetical protein
MELLPFFLTKIDIQQLLLLGFNGFLYLTKSEIEQLLYQWANVRIAPLRCQPLFFRLTRFRCARPHAGRAKPPKNRELTEGTALKKDQSARISAVDSSVMRPVIH